MLLCALHQNRRSGVAFACNPSVLLHSTSSAVVQVLTDYFEAYRAQIRSWKPFTRQMYFCVDYHAHAHAFRRIDPRKHGKRHENHVHQEEMVRADPFSRVARQTAGNDPRTPKHVCDDVNINTWADHYRGDGSIRRDSSCGGNRITACSARRASCTRG